MSIYKNGKLVAGGRQCMPLLSFMWADHILNDASWLRADTFSWQSGAMYQAAYAHLMDDIDGKYLQVEIIDGITIFFYLADDGHKICPASEEDKMLSIYNKTGVAWYYIIDRTNQRFKLPRTKFGFTGIRSGVGGFVPAGAPNIIGKFTVANSSQKGNIVSTDGCVYADGNTGGAYTSFAGDGNSASGPKVAHIDASRSSSVYGNSDTVQPKATEMYLYFYVGNFTQTALENTAGVTTEVLNTKVTVGHEVVEFQAPTAANNYTWYRKYADGWVEQGGILSVASNSQASATLPVVMADANYTITNGFQDTSNSKRNNPLMILGASTTSITLGHQASATMKCHWQVSGMAA